MTSMGELLNRPSDSSLLSLRQRLMLAAGAILIFAACTDGYPIEDELVISPHALTQSERLQAMNQLGQDAYPGIEWIYRALSDCILQITVEGVESGKQTFSLQMAGAGIDVSSNKADEAFGVQVVPIEGESLEKQHVLLSKTWLDAVAMRNLLLSFQIVCQVSAGPVSSDNTHLS